MWLYICTFQTNLDLFFRRLATMFAVIALTPRKLLLSVVKINCHHIPGITYYSDTCWNKYLDNSKFGFVFDIFYLWTYWLVDLQNKIKLCFKTNPFLNRWSLELEQPIYYYCTRPLSNRWLGHRLGDRQVVGTSGGAVTCAGSTHHPTCCHPLDPICYLLLRW